MDTAITTVGAQALRESVWLKLAEQAPAMVLLVLVLAFLVHVFLRALRAQQEAAAAERAAQAQQFLAHLSAAAERERVEREDAAAREDAGRQELRACVDRNTVVIARATVVMEAAERRDEERRQGERRDFDRRQPQQLQP
jgi:hypothetical protein